MPRGSLDLGPLSEAGDWDIFPQDSFLDTRKWLHQLSGLPWAAHWHSHHGALLTLHSAHSCSGFLRVLNPVGESLGS